MNPLVPAGDPAMLPGPPGLFHLLWVVTFTIHLLLVDVVLGGTLLSAISLASGRSGEGRDLAAWFASINTWAIAFTISFAIPPLLFVQVLYGRFFYSATILVAGAWLAVLVLLTVAYYLNYIVKRRLRAGAAPTLLVFLQALLFLTIAAIQVAVNLLHLRPDRWGLVADRPWMALGDPAFVPRYLHFVLAAVAATGAVLAWWRMRRGAPAGPLPREVRFGVQAALGATALQVPVGFLMLFTLPRDVLIGFMRGGAGNMIPLTLGVLTGIGALVVLALCLSPLCRPKLVRHAMELIAGTVVLMVMTRHQLREVYLAAANRGVTMASAPQWGPIALFGFCLLAAVVLVWVVLVRAVRDRPAPGEDAA